MSRLYRLGPYKSGDSQGLTNMAFAHNGDVQLHWREDGAGPPLLLLNSVGFDRAIWDARIATVRASGMAAIVEAVMARFFSEAFRAAHPSAVNDVRDRFLGMDKEGYAGCCAAIRDMALLDGIAAIAAPTLILA